MSLFQVSKDQGIRWEYPRRMKNRSGGTYGFFVEQLFFDDGEVHGVFVDETGCDFG